MDTPHALQLWTINFHRKIRLFLVFHLVFDGFLSHRYGSHKTERSYQDEQWTEIHVKLYQRISSNRLKTAIPLK